MANPYSGATSASTALTSIRGDDDKGFAHDQVLEPSDLSTWQLIRRLMGYARPHWVSLALSFVTAAISVVLQLYVPILIGQAIDHILAVGQVDFSELLLTLRWLAVTVVGAALTQWISLYCTNRLAYETSRDLRDEAYAKFNVLSLSFIDSHGDLLSRVINDVDAVGQGLLQGFTQLFGGVMTILVTIGYMCALSVPVALVVLVLTPHSVLAASWIARHSASSLRAQ